MVQVHSSKILLVQVRFGFIDLKFNCCYSFRPEKKKEIVDPVEVHHCSYCACTSVSGIRIWKKYILSFVRGSGSVRVHLSTILRVQVWFGFTEVKFWWFRFGSGSPKRNGSFGFTVRVQVRFDTLLKNALITLRNILSWLKVRTAFYSSSVGNLK